MTRAALFDIDGTLVDSVDAHAHAFVDTLTEFGKREVDFAAVRRQIGKGGEQIVRSFLNAEQFRRYGERIVARREQIYLERYLPEVRTFPKVRELFERIRHDGTQIVLATSAKKPVYEAMCKLLNVSDLIAARTTSDDAERAKPAPDIFAAALEQIGNPPASQAIAVGDSPYDAEAAGKINVRTIGVLCGGFDADWLRRAGCIAIYEDPADLLAHYDESPLHERHAA